MHNAAQTYFQTQMSTVHQGDIVILLFDAAIRNLNTAKEKIAEKDMAAKGNAISKAIDVINGLDNALNMEEGGDISENLHNIYFLCVTRLLKANLKADAEIIDNVLEMLTGIRDAFAQALEDPAAQAMAIQMSARNKVSQASFTAPTVTTAPTALSGKTVANSAYAQAANNVGAQNVKAAPQAQATQSVHASQSQAQNNLNSLMFQSALSQKFVADSSAQNAVQQNTIPQNSAQQIQQVQATPPPRFNTMNTMQNITPASATTSMTNTNSSVNPAPIQTQNVQSQPPVQENPQTPQLNNPLKKSLLQSSSIKLLQG